MGRCVWRIVYQVEAEIADFAGVDNMAVCIAKILSSIYKPRESKYYTKKSLMR